MRWRDDIIEAAQKTDVFWGIVKDGPTRREAMRPAVEWLMDKAAEDVWRELREDSDPVALSRAQARLSMLTAWLLLENMR